MRRWAVLLFLVGWTAVLGSGAARAQELKLSWWEHSNPPHNELSKELVAAWNKMRPDRTVDYQFFAMTPYFKKLSVALSTRTAPDLFTVIDFLLPSFTEKKVLGPIRPEWLGYKSLDEMKAAYLPGALEGYIAEGKLYAVPMISSTFSLYINKKHFREAGLDPEKDYPRTWEDIGRVGKKLVRMEGGRMVREGFDFAMHSSTWTMWYMQSLIHQLGGDILDPTGKRCAVNSEAGVRAMRIRAMYAHDHKISDPTVSVGTNALPASDLAVGRVSMFITHAGSVAQFGPKLMQDLKVVPFPQVNPAKPVTVVYGFALAVSPYIPEARQRAAHEVIRYVIQEPKRWYERTSYPYPSRGFLDIPGMREKPYLDVFVGDISTGRYLVRSAKIIEINEAMHRAMERVVLNREDPKRSLDQACREIDLALSKP